jgi:hypothetical protein
MPIYFSLMYPPSFDIPPAEAAVAVKAAYQKAGPTRNAPIKVDPSNVY